MENIYLILKDLPGTYCNTIHIVCDNLEQAIQVCENLNTEGRNGIRYQVRKASDYAYETQ